MSLRRETAIACLGVQALLTIGCDTDRHRVFPTEAAAVAYFRSHQDEYRALAEDWFASGHQLLYWYGWTNFREVYTWNSYWVTPSTSWWEAPRWAVTHWDGREYIVQSANSFSETARLAGSSGEEILEWQRRLASLHIDGIRNVSAVKDGTSFRYVEVQCLPLRQAYGFRFSPRSDLISTQELASWAKGPQRPGYRMDDIQSGTFYYEGLSQSPGPSSALPDTPSTAPVAPDRSGSK